MSRWTDELWSHRSARHDRPTIVVIEPAGDDEERRRKRLDDAAGRGPVSRVPFGFARALFEQGICGRPHPRNPRSYGGCELELGHGSAHRWRPHDPAPIRPTRTT